MNRCAFVPLYLVCLFSSCFKTFVHHLLSTFDFDALECKYVCMHECMYVCIYAACGLFSFLDLWVYNFHKIWNISDTIFPNFFCSFLILILGLQLYFCWTSSYNPLGDLRIYFFFFPSLFFPLCYVWDRFYCCVQVHWSFPFVLSNLLIPSSEIFISYNKFFLFHLFF